MKSTKTNIVSYSSVFNVQFMYFYGHF